MKDSTASPVMTFRLPWPMRLRLERLARAHNVPVGVIIREAVEARVRRDERKLAVEIQADDEVLG